MAARHAHQMDADVADADLERFERLFGPPAPEPRPRRNPKPFRAVPLDVVARELGVTPNRVKQIEQQALAKCKRILEQCGYRVSDLM